MTRILLVSLGGSPEPVVNCIASLRPDRVVFLCSEGSRSQVDTVLASVPLPNFDAERDVEVLQQRFSRRQGEEVVSEIDHLDLVYSRAADLLMRLRRENPGSNLTVDYTGGTKTMAAGLALAAIDAEAVQVRVTTSPERPKGENTVSGPSVPVTVAKADIQARRLLDLELPPLLRRYDYQAARLAVSRVRELLDRTDASSRLLLRLEKLLDGLDGWDRFDHAQAFAQIESVGDAALAKRFLLPLRRIQAGCKLVEAEGIATPMAGSHGLEAVEDLLLNADRRASQDRWDDAVGRLYRAAELTAQILLRIDVSEQVGPEGIVTADVAIDRLPDHVQEEFRLKPRVEGKVQLGLRDAFDLLTQLDHPLGRAWAGHRSRYVDLLKIRNHSLFAHGFQPITYGDWRRLRESFGGLLEEAIKYRRTGSGGEPIAQLPSRLRDLLP
jgi:CRISPR-associated protein (TIGR02710 family)